IARNQKKRCDGPSFAAVPTQLEPTIKTICVRTRSRRPRGFVSATLCSSTSRSARSSSVVIVEARSGTALTLQQLSLVDLIVLVFCTFRRWWFVSEFAVPNFAASVSDVATGSQSRDAKQNHCHRAQEGKRVEKIDEILPTIFVRIEPGFPILIGHR